jgi:hypothetical protein
MPGKYCAGCGEQKRLRWNDAFCTMRCAAQAASMLAGASCADLHCFRCGEIGCGGQNCYEDAALAAAEGRADLGVEPVERPVCTCPFASEGYLSKNCALHAAEGPGDTQS